MAITRVTPKKRPKCARGKCKNESLPNSKYCSIGCYTMAKPQVKMPPYPMALNNLNTAMRFFGKTIKKIAPRSKKRAAEEREYIIIRARFLKGVHVCPVFPDEPVTDVHHKKGRIGKLLTDVRYFLAVSRKGHDYIETHPEEAYQKGWSLKRNAKEENNAD